MSRLAVLLLTLAASAGGCAAESPQTHPQTHPQSHAVRSARSNPAPPRSDRVRVRGPKSASDNPCKQGTRVAGVSVGRAVIVRLRSPAHAACTIRRARPEQATAATGLRR